MAHKVVSVHKSLARMVQQGTQKQRRRRKKRKLADPKLHPWRTKRFKK